MSFVLWRQIIIVHHLSVTALTAVAKSSLLSCKRSPEKQNKVMYKIFQWYVFRIRNKNLSSDMTKSNGKRCLRLFHTSRIKNDSATSTPLQGLKNKHPTKL